MSVGGGVLIVVVKEHLFQNATFTQGKTDEVLAKSSQDKCQKQVLQRGTTGSKTVWQG